MDRGGDVRSPAVFIVGQACGPLCLRWRDPRHSGPGRARVVKPCRGYSGRALVFDFSTRIGLALGPVGLSAGAAPTRHRRLARAQEGSG